MTPSLDIDHVRRFSCSDDGLYTGEEVCMLGEENNNTNDDNDETGLLDSIVCGIDQIGVEIELNGSLLSSSTDDGLTLSDTMMSVEETSPPPPSISSPENEEVADKIEDEEQPSATLDHTPIDAVVDSNNCPTAAEEVISGGVLTIHDTGNCNGRSSSQPIRSTSTTLRTLRRQILMKATSRIKLMSPKKKKRNQRRTLYNSNPSSSPPLSPQARDALKDDDNITNGKEKANNINDDATCCESSSVTSRNSNSPNSTAQSLVHTPSSITASTCDFGQHNEPNHHAIFSNYLVSNPWEAAKAGDYATLSYIAKNHADDNIWTQKDEAGYVPLYYACVSYNNAPNCFGKYGLESVKLLLKVWPVGVDLPEELFTMEGEESGTTGPNSSSSSNDNSNGNEDNKMQILHKDVLDILSRSTKTKGMMSWMPHLPEIMEQTSVDAGMVVEGVSDVVPVSFLEDLGDDGYVEDY